MCKNIISVLFLQEYILAFYANIAFIVALTNLPCFNFLQITANNKIHTNKKNGGLCSKHRSKMILLNKMHIFSEKRGTT